MIRLEECPICKEDNWHKLEHLRNSELWQEADYRDVGEETGFKVCKNCGFLTYDYIDQDRLSLFYNRDNKVNAHKIVTQNRKMLYHDRFLSEFQINGNILDVGCATGHLLNYLDNDDNILYGVEVDKPQANFAVNEFGINLLDSIGEAGVKFDFISYYHVLEHLQHPEKEIEKIKNNLADNGLVYISVPMYSDCIFKGDGSPVIDFEDWFHLNHVNCFTEKSILNLFKDFEVVKLDSKMYCNTYIFKLLDKSREIDKENYKDIAKRLELQKQAIELQQQRKHEEALSVYKNFPDCWVQLNASLQKSKDFKALVQSYTAGIDACDDDFSIKINLARLYLQWDESTGNKKSWYSNNIQKSEIILNEIEKEKPVEDVYFMLALINFQYKKDMNTALMYFRKILDINPLRFDEITKFIGIIYAE